MSPDSYPFLFTVEWLNGINKERRVGRLERCLLAAGEKVLSVSWPELVYPQFVHKDGFIVGQRCPADLAPEVLGTRSPGDGRHSGGENRESEGEYVHLLEVSPTLHQAPRILEPCSGQIQTMPTRKGHNKSRSRRHRAWLHHKSGCGENFALRKACKAQQAEQSGQESGPTPEDRVAQQQGELSHAFCQASEVSQAAESPSPGFLEQNLGPFGTDSQPALFGGAATEDTKGLGKPELPEAIHQDPASSREGSNENCSPASATPKRATKGNRRKKKGVGRGAGARYRLVGDLNSKETGACMDVKDAIKEEASLGPAERDSGNGEPTTSTREQIVSTEECHVFIPDCSGIQKSSSIPGDPCIGTREEVGTGESVAGTPEYGAGIGEPEGSSEKGSTGIRDSSICTRKSIGTEDPNPSAEAQQTGVISNSEPGDGAEEQSAAEQGTSAEGNCPSKADVTIDHKEVASTKVPEEILPSTEEKEGSQDHAAEQGKQEAQAAPPLAVTHVGQAVDWELLRLGVFTLTGKSTAEHFCLWRVFWWGLKVAACILL